MLNADHRLLHAYLDDDLPADLAAAFGARLENDPELRAALSREQAFRSAIAADAQAIAESPELAQAASRVRARLEPLASGGAVYSLEPRVSRRSAVLGALGAAAASAIFILGLQGLAGTRVPDLADSAGTQWTSVSTARNGESSEGVAVTVGVQDVEQLLQILNARSGITELRIELPQSPRFEIIGDPTLIRRPPHEAAEEESP